MNNYTLRGALIAAHAAILFKVSDWSGYKTPAPYPEKWIAVCAIGATIGLALAFRSLSARDHSFPWDARVSYYILGAIVGFWLVAFLQLTDLTPSWPELKQMLGW
ncbi:MAG: hypothetical protein H7124_16145 [Phycisphaerales bacterium]|nr:hypothetical protein [Hyphomonadaceae bacterium]